MLKVNDLSNLQYFAYKGYRVLLELKEEYGNTSLGKKITIGKVDVIDTKKFTDISYWKEKYGTFKMWNKDRKEYEDEKNRILQNTKRGAFNIIPAYKPKSIR